MSKSNPELVALRLAIEKAGGQVALAEAMNAFLPDGRKLRQGNVWSWLHRSCRISPPDMAIVCEKATGVPRQDLRPDIYPVEQAA